MTIWVLHQALNSEQEAHIVEQPQLMLPFEGLPDLSMMASPQAARQLIGALHPDEPPEAITRRVDRFWNLFTGLQSGDLIAVPLAMAKEVVIAEVSGRYQYQVGARGEDVHSIPVSWYEKRVPLAKFGKHRDVFAPRTEKMYEVTFQDARIAIRDHLPHSYNRFAKWKWLIGAFFVLAMLQMMERMIRQ